MKKILLLEFFQPEAHYRDAKIKQDDYIASYNLPPATTIAGMISYVCEKRFEEEIRISVVGEHKRKRVDFIRGENGDILEKYERFLNKKIKHNKKNNIENNYKDFSQQFNYIKRESGNRVMNFEVLEDVELKIFIDTDNEVDYELIKTSFEKPNKYLSLGRKEDFIMPIKKGNSYIREIQIDNKKINEKKQALKEKLKFKNTYVPIKLIKNNQDNDLNIYDEILNKGVYYSLPKTYKNLKDSKKDREIIFGDFVYISEEGAYLKNIDFNVYENFGEKIVFKWLVGDKNE